MTLSPPPMLGPSSPIGLLGSAPVQWLAQSRVTSIGLSGTGSGIGCGSSIFCLPCSLPGARQPLFKEPLPIPYYPPLAPPPSNRAYTTCPQGMLQQRTAGCTDLSAVATYIRYSTFVTRYMPAVATEIKPKYVAI